MTLLATNYETRKSYSDIAASIDVALGKYVISSSAQFNPDTSKIVKKENSLRIPLIHENL